MISPGQRLRENRRFMPLCIHSSRLARYNDLTWLESVVPASPGLPSKADYTCELDKLVGKGFRPYRHVSPAHFLMILFNSIA